MCEQVALALQGDLSCLLSVITVHAAVCGTAGLGCAQVLDGLVPMLLARRAEQERRARAAQRLHKQMGEVLRDAEGGFGRCALPCRASNQRLWSPRSHLLALAACCAQAAVACFVAAQSSSYCWRCRMPQARGSCRGLAVLKCPVQGAPRAQGSRLLGRGVRQHHSGGHSHAGRVRPGCTRPPRCRHSGAHVRPAWLPVICPPDEHPVYHNL